MKKSLLIDVSGIEHAAFETMVSWVKRAAARTWKVLGVLADSTTGADYYEARIYWHLGHQDRRLGQRNWSLRRFKEKF